MRRFAWLLIAAVSAGCGAEQGSGAASGYKVIDSGVGATDHQVYWLDNERVIFQGYEGAKPRNREEGKRLRLGLYIWNVTTGKVERYADSGSGLCYADGYIYYQTKQEIVQERPEMQVRDTWREGLFGREIERVQVWRQDKGKATVIWDDGKGREVPRSEWNRLTCKAVSRPLSMQGRYWVPLREGDGYLDMGPVTDISARHAVILHRADGAEVSTNLRRAGVAGPPWFSALNDAYLLQPIGWGNDWKTTGCQGIHWIFRTGDVRSVCVPMRWWLGGGHTGQGTAFVFTKRGFLTIIGNEKDRSWGTYLVEGEQGRRLIPGIVHGVAVSPDGCAIAFAHAPDWEAVRIGGRGQRAVKAIDLCSQERTTNERRN